MVNWFQSSADYYHHLLKVDVDGVVQDALTMRLVHHDQGVDLREDDEDLTLKTKKIKLLEV